MRNRISHPAAPALVCLIFSFLLINGGAAPAAAKLRGPGALAVSPDGQRLYVADTHTGRLYAWNVTSPGVVDTANPLGGAGGELLCGLPGNQLFDSLGVDGEGNVVVATLVTGALTVAGNLAFASGALYVTHVTPSAASRTNVTGTATLGGTVTNASEVAVGPVQLEFVLSRREDVRLTVAKLIDVEPNQLAPQTSAKYQFKISTKEFQDSKLARAMNGQAAIKFKNLGVVEPAPATDTQPANQPANNGPKPKVDDDKIYDGSVSVK